jgi:hypothetical protein
MIAILKSFSTGGTTVVYRESDHELVGGGWGIDAGGPKVCGQTWGFYRTANVDLSQCADYTICSPCAPGGLHPLCSKDELPDADGGT